jgi:hypothetical protein
MALEACGGVSSSRDLDPDGFKVVMRHFESCGFRQNNRPGMATNRQLAKIRAQWSDLANRGYCQKDRKWQALRGLLKSRMGVSDLRFLDFKHAYDVIEALKQIRERL